MLVISVGATGIQIVEARDAAKHPTMHKTYLATKNYPIVLRSRNPGVIRGTIVLTFLRLNLEFWL